MNKSLPLISLFIMSIISILYWTFKPKELYEAKWNAPDTTLAITINGEISTTFPTTNMYTGTVDCTSGTGKVEWKNSKWILTTSGVTNGSTRCNANFTYEATPPKGWDNAATGTLLAAIKNNSTVGVAMTKPGQEVSAHVVDDITETTSVSVSTTYQNYYWTYGTAWQANGTKFDLINTAITSGTYANSYSEIVGKYLISSSSSGNGNSTATLKSGTNLSSVYYVVSATATSFVYKQITSNRGTTEAVLAGTNDDYGGSYYFRGTVKNNYVKFANKCWRIVRITGNGAIKLVLHNDNTSSVTNPCSSTNNSSTAAFARYSGTTYTSKFNDSSDYNAYVGFMYGTTDISTAFTNTNKSTIMTNLETWYKNNLSSYESKLADVIWCNDKETIADMSYDPRGIRSAEIVDDSGRVALYHAAYKRIMSSGNSDDLQPSLICTNNISKLTVNDMTNGNGALTYKIGLLTADEVAFAGMSSLNKNFSSYLTENTGSSYWWTLSPAYFAYLNMMDHNVIRAEVLEVGNSISYGLPDGTLGVRPSIALTSSTTISGGNGTSENPYLVK